MQMPPFARLAGRYAARAARLGPSLRGAVLRRDVLAGLGLAAVAIPEQLATARLAGLPATQGLMVFAVASVVMILIARDRALSVGADSTIAPMVAVSAVAATTAGAGAAMGLGTEAPGSAAGSAALLALMVGTVLWAIAALGLDWLARLLSKAVAAGMMAGIALHILIGRLPTALGMDLPAASPVATLFAMAARIDTARAAPLAVAMAVALTCLVGHARAPRWPAPLIALGGALAVAVVFDPAGIWLPTLAIGPDGGGAPQAAGFDRDQIIALAPAALSIAFLCLSQTAVILREGRAPDTAPRRRNAIAAVGVANIACGLAGGFPVNASPPRTAMLRAAGATSQLAGLVAAMLGVAVAALGSGLVARLPAAALAGVLICLALRLFPRAALADLLRRSRPEGAIALATAALVTLLPLQAGLPLAIALSLIWASAPVFQPRVAVMRQVPGSSVWWHSRPRDPESPAGAPLVLGLSSSMNFANAELVAADIRAHIAALPQPPRLLVLECAGLLSVDLTAADTLAALVTELRGAGIAVALARLESQRAEEELRRAGFFAHLGQQNLFLSVDQAVRAGGGDA